MSISCQRGVQLFGFDAPVALPVVDEVSKTLMSTGNRKSAAPARAVVGEPKGSVSTNGDRLDEIIVDARETEYASVVRAAAKQNLMLSRLSSRRFPKMYWTFSKAAGEEKEEEIFASELAKYFAGATSKVDIISAYFVPRKRGTEWSRELEARGRRGWS